MTATLELEILTPTGPLREAHGVQTDGICLPGALGELGILADHIPFLTPIVPGIARFRADGKDHRFAIGSGFVEVSSEGKVTVLSDRVKRASEIDRAGVNERLTQLRQQLDIASKGQTDTKEYRELEREYAWIEAQVRLVGQA